MEPLITDELWRQFEPLIPKHPQVTQGRQATKG
jgi:transposase